MEEREEEEEDEDIINEDKKGDPPIATKAQTKMILTQMETHICKIILKESIGTGFFCKIRYPDEFHLLPVLITNNHILNKNELEINKIIRITLNDGLIAKNIILDKSRLIYTNKSLDTTIIEIKAEDKIDKFLDVDDNVFDNDYLNIYEKDTPIYIIQYPEGAIASQSMGNIIQLSNKKIYHSCGTFPGSSGSPILLLSNFKVIGIHRGLKKTINNKAGIFIKYPIEDFNKKNTNRKIEVIRIIQGEDLKNNSEYSEKINEKSENHNYIYNNDTESYLEKYKDDFVLGNDRYYDYLFIDNYNYMENINRNNNYKVDYNDVDINIISNNSINKNTNNNNNNHYQYPINNSINNNKINNNNREMERQRYVQKRGNNSIQQTIPVNNNNIIIKPKKVLIMMCSSCYSKKICCICRNRSNNLTNLNGSFYAHSTCINDRTCLNCGYYGSGHHVLRTCEKCKNIGLKLSKIRCFKCNNSIN